MQSPLSVIFAGTPDFAAKHLQALVDSRHQVVAVYSQPDRPAGRGQKPRASAVKQLATENALPVYQPQSFSSVQTQAELASFGADIMIVVAYGLLLPEAILNTPKHGCLNVHGSLLPAWRGAAPIQRAIWAGDKHTGVTIMQMDNTLDTGAVLLKRSIAIANDDTSASLYEKLAVIGPQALIDTLEQLAEIKPEPQDGALASYAKKLSKREAEIDWQLPANQLERNCRAFNPWPMTFFQFENKHIKVHRCEVESHPSKAVPAGQVLAVDASGIVVKAGLDAVRLTVIQLPGKKAMAVADVLNSRKNWILPGTQLQAPTHE